MGNTQNLKKKQTHALKYPKKASKTTNPSKIKHIQIRKKKRRSRYVVK